MMDASYLSAGIAPQGTFAYAAPELLMGRRCDEKVCCAEIHRCSPSWSALKGWLVPKNMSWCPANTILKILPGCEELWTLSSLQDPSSLGALYEVA